MSDAKERQTEPSTANEKPQEAPAKTCLDSTSAACPVSVPSKPKSTAQGVPPFVLNSKWSPFLFVRTKNSISALEHDLCSSKTVAIATLPMNTVVDNKRCQESTISHLLAKLASLSNRPQDMTIIIRVLSQTLGNHTSASSAAQLEKELSSGKWLQPLVDVLFSHSTTTECLYEANGLLLNICASFKTTQPIVCRMIFARANQLATKVLDQVAAVCKELKQKKSALTSATTAATTIIQDRYSNDAIVIRTEVEGSNETQVHPNSMTPLVVNSSLQFVLLRNLKTATQIRAMNDKLEELKKQAEEILQMDDLWNKLTECFQLLVQSSDKQAVLSLQPLMESFFEVNAPVRSKINSPTETLAEQLKHISQNSPSSESASDKAKLSAKETETESFAKDPSNKFVRFITANRDALNQILRNTNGRWCVLGNPFETLVDYTRVLDFDVKREYLQRQLLRLENDDNTGSLDLRIHRSHLFEDSFRELQRKSPSEWRNSFRVGFIGEAGEDAGGLLREWYTSISRAIFNPDYALFTLSGDQATYMINRSSYCNPSHISYFKFVGRVIAKAIYDQHHLDSYFTRSFYKHILGKTVHYTDMQAEDKALFNGLTYLLEHNLAEVGIDMHFVLEVEEFGVQKTTDLIPNGRNIAVTDANKHEYVKCVCQEKMTNSIRSQLTAFLEGFYSLLPKRLITIFNEHELELLIAGLPTIDVGNLKQNTLYDGFQEDSPQIQWFWKALHSFDQTDRAKFLQFVTGTSKTPLGGFTALGEWRFTIRRDDRSPDRLPGAHTCSNQMELPAYESYEKLRQMVLKAIHEGAEGFGFV